METGMQFVGIDVGEQELEVYVRPSMQGWKVANTPTGQQQVVAR